MRGSESTVYCRNRESKLPDIAGYSSVISHYSATTRQYTFGARFGARVTLALSVRSLALTASGASLNVTNTINLSQCFYRIIQLN